MVAYRTAGWDTGVCESPDINASWFMGTARAPKMTNLKLSTRSRKIVLPEALIIIQRTNTAKRERKNAMLDGAIWVTASFPATWVKDEKRLKKNIANQIIIFLFIELLIVSINSSNPHFLQKLLQQYNLLGLHRLLWMNLVKMIFCMQFLSNS